MSTNTYNICTGCIYDNYLTPYGLAKEIKLCLNKLKNKEFETIEKNFVIKVSQDAEIFPYINNFSYLHNLILFHDKPQDILNIILSSEFLSYIALGINDDLNQPTKKQLIKERLKAVLKYISANYKIENSFILPLGCLCKNLWFRQLNRLDNKFIQEKTKSKINKIDEKTVTTFQQSNNNEVEIVNTPNFEDNLLKYKQEEVSTTVKSKYQTFLYGDDFYCKGVLGSPKKKLKDFKKLHIAILDETEENNSNKHNNNGINNQHQIDTEDCITGVTIGKKENKTKIKNKPPNNNMKNQPKILQIKNNNANNIGNVSSYINELPNLKSYNNIDRYYSFIQLLLKKMPKQKHYELIKKTNLNIAFGNPTTFQLLLFSGANIPLLFKSLVSDNKIIINLVDLLNTPLFTIDQNNNNKLNPEQNKNLEEIYDLIGVSLKRNILELDDYKNDALSYAVMGNKCNRYVYRFILNYVLAKLKHNVITQKSLKSLKDSNKMLQDLKTENISLKGILKSGFKLICISSFIGNDTYITEILWFILMNLENITMIFEKNNLWPTLAAIFKFTWGVASYNNNYKIIQIMLMYYKILIIRSLKIASQCNSLKKELDHLTSEEKGGKSENKIISGISICTKKLLLLFKLINAINFVQSDVTDQYILGTEIPSKLTKVEMLDSRTFSISEFLHRISKCIDFPRQAFDRILNFVSTHSKSLPTSEIIIKSKSNDKEKSDHLFKNIIDNLEKSCNEKDISTILPDLIEFINDSFISDLDTLAIQITSSIISINDKYRAIKSNFCTSSIDKQFALHSLNGNIYYKNFKELYQKEKSHQKYKSNKPTTDIEEQLKNNNSNSESGLILPNKEKDSNNVENYNNKNNQEKRNIFSFIDYDYYIDINKEEKENKNHMLKFEYLNLGNKSMTTINPSTNILNNTANKKNILIENLLTKVNKIYTQEFNKMIVNYFVKKYIPSYNENQLNQILLLQNGYSNRIADVIEIEPTKKTSTNPNKVGSQQKNEMDVKYKIAIKDNKNENDHSNIITKFPFDVDMSFCSVNGQDNKGTCGYVLSHEDDINSLMKFSTSFSSLNIEKDIEKFDKKVNISIYPTNSYVDSLNNIQNKKDEIVYSFCSEESSNNDLDINESYINNNSNLNNNFTSLNNKLSISSIDSTYITNIEKLLNNLIENISMLMENSHVLEGKIITANYLYYFILNGQIDFENFMDRYTKYDLIQWNVKSYYKEIPLSNEIYSLIITSIDSEEKRGTNRNLEKLKKSYEKQINQNITNNKSVSGCMCSCM